MKKRNVTLAADKFLDLLEGALRPVKSIVLESNRKQWFRGQLAGMIRPLLSFVAPAPAPQRLVVYAAMLRNHWNQLFVGNDPTKPPKPNLQPWQQKLAAQDYDLPSRRRTVAGASYDAAVFRIKLLPDEAVEMVQWLNTNPAVGNKLKDSIRMGGVAAFREWINGDPNWN